MSEAEKLFGREHVERYRETGGNVGHIWKEGSTVLLLTTTGRKTGEERTTPLIYAEDGDRYVIVASKGGAPEDPGWYRNLEKTPEVELQVRDDVFAAHARYRCIRIDYCKARSFCYRGVCCREMRRFDDNTAIDIRIYEGAIDQI